MKFTDLFIERPVLATVVSLMILALGIRSLGSLPIRQYPFTQNAVISVSTVYTGADPSLIAGFITTPMENSIAQAAGIDYMTSTSNQNVSTIQVYLKLNYDPEKALADVTTKVNAVLSQLPRDSLPPVITISIGQTIDALYIGFYSKILATNQISDYLLRVVQPKLQAINGVQVAEILGNRQFAMRIWLDPVKLAGFNLTPTDVAQALAANDFISAVGRTDGSMFTVNLAASTGLSSVEEFRNLIVRATRGPVQATPGPIIRLKDLGTVSLGATNYDTAVSFDEEPAVYMGIQLSPSANLLTVLEDVRKAFPKIVEQLPQGLNAKIVYDSSQFVDSSINEVVKTLLEAITIVTVVIFLFLGTIRSVIIPVVAIPLSLIGTFFIMLVFGYSINLLTLLALVLAIGLVVDDAIIVVENVQRHMEAGMSRVKAAMLGAQELAGPIVAISIVLVAVYAPMGFMGGLTGALFTEFAFTLAGAVGVSAVIALTLSPMMCSKFLIVSHSNKSLVYYIDRVFENLRVRYERVLHDSLNFLPVVGVFAAIILTSIYFLFAYSQAELAPDEDQGFILSQVTAAPNATLQQTLIYMNQVYKIFRSHKETERVFEIGGANGLNTGILGMALIPWEDRDRTTNQLQPLLQKEMNNITGAIVSAFQLPPLPGASGLPVQFVIQTTDSYDRLNEINQLFLKKVKESGLFLFSDTDLKIDKAQSTLVLDRDKTSQFGLTMQTIGNALGFGLSQGYINYFNYAGRSYQVIPQMNRDERLNAEQILDYYIRTSNGQPISISDLNGKPFSLATIAKVETTVVPESINHFQQLNSATLIGVPAPGITTGDALAALQTITDEILPDGYTVDYAGQSRQYIQESSALLVSFIFALIIIFLSLAALFESFRDPLIVLISVPMSICGAMIFICLGVGGASLNIYTEVGLITLIGLISKHGILIVQFANDLQKEGKSKREAIEMAAAIRLRPILMTTASMVLGVIPLIIASGAGAVSRFNIGLVIATGIAIGTLFTLFVVPAVYLAIATDHQAKLAAEEEPQIAPE